MSRWTSLPALPNYPTDEHLQEQRIQLAIEHYRRITTEVIPRFLPDIIQLSFPKSECRQRRRRNTSTLQGADWVVEIINGTDERFYDNFRMKKHIFRSLVDTLTSRGYLYQSNKSSISPIEEIAMFLRVVCMGHTLSEEHERFQHTRSTISNHFYRVLEAVLNLSRDVIRRPCFEQGLPQIAEYTKSTHILQYVHPYLFQSTFYLQVTHKSIAINSLL